jgi:hypothetical protein
MVELFHVKQFDLYYAFIEPQKHLLNQFMSTTSLLKFSSLRLIEHEYQRDAGLYFDISV